MSVVIDYNRSTDPLTGSDFGVRGGSISLQQPVMLDPNKKKAFRVIQCILSAQIPNIYSYGSYSNTDIRLSNNGGTSWITCRLPPGIYTVAMIQDSVNNVINQLGWYTSPTDVGITINYNPATSQVYTVLDSTKLVGGIGQLGIDFSTTQIYKLLGYPRSASTFITNGLFGAPQPAEMDAQSTYVEVSMSCIQGCRWLNGQLNNTLCRIPLQISQAQNEIIFPSGTTGMVSPVIQASIPTIIQSFTIQVTNGNGQETVFMNGNFILSIELIDL